MECAKELPSQFMVNHEHVHGDCHLRRCCFCHEQMATLLVSTTCWTCWVSWPCYRKNAKCCRFQCPSQGDCSNVHARQNSYRCKKIATTYWLIRPVCLRTFRVLEPSIVLNANKHCLLSLQGSDINVLSLSVSARDTGATTAMRIWFAFFCLI